MKNLMILGLPVALAFLLACTGCSGVKAQIELPPDPVGCIACAPLAAKIVTPLADILDDDREPQEPYVEDEGKEGEEYYDDEEEGKDKDKKKDGKTEFPFDKQPRFELSFNALYRERNNHGSDSESQELLLEPELGIIVHKYFEVLAGMGLYWLRGEEKDLFITQTPVVSGTIPGSYRVEERYLDLGGRVNLHLENMHSLVPFAEIKLGMGTHAEWNRIISRYDLAARSSLAFGTRIFVCEDRKAAVTVKFNVHHFYLSESEVTIGTRSDRELLFGFALFF